MYTSYLPLLTPDFHTVKRITTEKEKRGMVNGVVLSVKASILLATWSGYVHVSQSDVYYDNSLHSNPYRITVGMIFHQNQIDRDKEKKVFS